MSKRRASPPLQVLLSPERWLFRSNLIAIAREVIDSTAVAIKTYEDVPTIILEHKKRCIKISVPVDDSDRLWFRWYENDWLRFSALLDRAWTNVVKNESTESMRAFVTLAQSVLRLG
jgi:hypothetical protein